MEKQAKQTTLTFHANCFQGRQFAGNVKSCFMEKKQINRPRWLCIAHLSIIALREPDLELINANILIKIHDDYINK